MAKSGERFVISRSLRLISGQGISPSEFSSSACSPAWSLQNNADQCIPQFSFRRTVKRDWIAQWPISNVGTAGQPAPLYQLFQFESDHQWYYSGQHFWLRSPQAWPWSPSSQPWQTSHGCGWPPQSQGWSMERTGASSPPWPPNSLVSATLASTTAC